MDTRRPEGTPAVQDDLREQDAIDKNQGPYGQVPTKWSQRNEELQDWLDSHSAGLGRKDENGELWHVFMIDGDWYYGLSEEVLDHMLQSCPSVEQRLIDGETGVGQLKVTVHNLVRYREEDSARAVVPPEVSRNNVRGPAPEERELPDESADEDHPEGEPLWHTVDDVASTEGIDEPFYVVRFGQGSGDYLGPAGRGVGTIGKVAHQADAFYFTHPGQPMQVVDRGTFPNGLERNSLRYARVVQLQPRQVVTYEEKIL